MVYPLIVIGSEGYIGRQFCGAYPQALAVKRAELDLLNPKICFDTDGYRFALIAAGIGNPKLCEQDPERSLRCNVTGTLTLAKELLKKGVCPIFCSSDYVFNDELQIEPLNVYGEQKALLEFEAQTLDSLVIRLTKVYGSEKGDQTLFDEMASALSEGRSISAAHDQIFAPVNIEDVVSTVGNLIAHNQRGVVNIAGPEYASRYEMALYLAEKLNVDAELVKKIALDDLNDSIKRPKTLRHTSSLSTIGWRDGIERVAKNYSQEKTCSKTSIKLGH